MYTYVFLLRQEPFDMILVINLSYQMRCQTSSKRSSSLYIVTTSSKQFSILEDKSSILYV
jgi:hypothetical protein